MISRVTIFSLLLAAMLTLAIYRWSSSVADRCNSYPAGGAAPKSEYVISGERQIVVPCNDWWMRQPLGVQIFCIADALLCVLFLFNALQDLRQWLTWRRTRVIR